MESLLSLRPRSSTPRRIRSLASPLGRVDAYLLLHHSRGIRKLYPISSTVISLHRIRSEGPTRASHPPRSSPILRALSRVFSWRGYLGRSTRVVGDMPHLRAKRRPPSFDLGATRERISQAQTRHGVTSPHILHLSRGVLWNQIKMRIDESCSADSGRAFQGLRKDPTGGMLQNPKEYLGHSVSEM